MGFLRRLVSAFVFTAAFFITGGIAGLTALGGAGFFTTITGSSLWIKTGLFFASTVIGGEINNALRTQPGIPSHESTIYSGDAPALNIVGVAPVGGHITDFQPNVDVYNNVDLRDEECVIATYTIANHALTELQDIEIAGRWINIKSTELKQTRIHPINQDLRGLVAVSWNITGDGVQLDDSPLPVNKLGIGLSYVTIYFYRTKDWVGKTIQNTRPWERVRFRGNGGGNNPATLLAIHLKNTLGLDDSNIDQPSLAIAEQHCRDLDYQANGTWTSGEEEGVTTWLAQAMDGAVVQSGDKFYIHAGVNSVPKTTINKKDHHILSFIVNNPTLAWNDMANTIQAQIVDSAQNYRRVSTPKLVHRAAFQRDDRNYTRNVGGMRFVNNQDQARKILSQIIARAQERTTISVVVHDSTLPKGLSVWDKILIESPEDGVFGDYRILNMARSIEGVVFIECSRETDDVWKPNIDFISLPPNDYFIPTSLDPKPPTNLNVVEQITVNNAIVNSKAIVTWTNHETVPTTRLLAWLDGVPVADEYIVDGGSTYTISGLTNGKLVVILRGISEAGLPSEETNEKVIDIIAEDPKPPKPRVPSITIVDPVLNIETVAGDNTFEIEFRVLFDRKQVPPTFTVENFERGTLIENKSCLPNAKVVSQVASWNSGYYRVGCLARNRTNGKATTISQQWRQITRDEHFVEFEESELDWPGVLYQIFLDRPSNLLISHSDRPAGDVDWQTWVSTAPNVYPFHRNTVNTTLPNYTTRWYDPAKPATGTLTKHLIDVNPNIVDLIGGRQELELFTWAVEYRQEPGGAVLTTNEQDLLFDGDPTTVEIDGYIDQFRVKFWVNFGRINVSPAVEGLGIRVTSSEPSTDEPPEDPASFPEVLDRTVIVDAFFNQTMPTADGFESGDVYELTPAVPGLAFNANNRQFRGTPTEPGVYFMEYRLKRNNDTIAFEDFYFTVLSTLGPGLPAVAVNIPAFTDNIEIYHTTSGQLRISLIEGRDGLPPYSYSVEMVSGDINLFPSVRTVGPSILVEGLTLDLDEAREGQTWEVNYIVTDSIGIQAIQPFTLEYTQNTGMVVFDQTDGQVFLLNQNDFDDTSGIWGHIGTIPSDWLLPGFTATENILAADTDSDGVPWIIVSDGAGFGPGDISKLYKVNVNNFDDTSGDFGLVGNLPSNLRSVNSLIITSDGRFFAIESGGTGSRMWRINPDNPIDENDPYGEIDSDFPRYGSGNNIFHVRGATQIGDGRVLAIGWPDSDNSDGTRIINVNLEDPGLSLELFRLRSANPYRLYRDSMTWFRGRVYITTGSGTARIASFDPDTFEFEPVDVADGNLPSDLGNARSLCTIIFPTDIVEDPLILNDPPNVIRQVSGNITPIVLPAASGGSGVYVYSLSELPATSLIFNSNTRTIAGGISGNSIGTHNMVYTVTDSLGQTLSRTWQFTITAPIDSHINPPVVLPPTPVGGLYIPVIDAQTIQMGQVTVITLPEAQSGVGNVYSISQTPGGVDFIGNFNLNGRELSLNPTDLNLGSTGIYSPGNSAGFRYVVTSSNGTTFTRVFVVLVRSDNVVMTAPTGLVLAYAPPLDFDCSFQPTWLPANAKIRDECLFYRITYDRPAGAYTMGLDIDLDVEAIGTVFADGQKANAYVSTFSGRNVIEAFVSMGERVIGIDLDIRIAAKNSNGAQGPWSDWFDISWDSNQ